MRSLQFSLLGTLFLFACGTTSGTGTETDGGAGSSGGESSTTAENPTTGASGGMVCVPGMSVACACPDGGMGAQVCNPDGKSFGMCSCEGGSASDSATTGAMTSGPVTTDAMTSGPMTTDAMTTDAMTSGPMTTGPDTTGGMGGCEDPGPEPNEVEMEAVDLGDQSCMAMAMTFTGVLNGDADVDWFRYHGVWQMFCGFNDPDAIQTLTASDTVRMCVFADCDQGETQFDCGDAQDEQSPEGLPGCCAMGSVSYVINCGGTGNESANVFVRLDQAPADSCVDYSVEYSYQESN